jgi:hypothetical protein
MTTGIDDHLSAKFMAAALNFNTAIKKHFGTRQSLDREQEFSIQFTSIDQRLRRRCSRTRTAAAHRVVYSAIRESNASR